MNHAKTRERVAARRKARKGRWDAYKKSFEPWEGMPGLKVGPVKPGVLPQRRITDATGATLGYLRGATKEQMKASGKFVGDELMARAELRAARVEEAKATAEALGEAGMSGLLAAFAANHNVVDAGAKPAKKEG